MTYLSRERLLTKLKVEQLTGRRFGYWTNTDKDGRRDNYAAICSKDIVLYMNLLNLQTKGEDYKMEIIKSHPRFSTFKDRFNAGFFDLRRILKRNTYFLVSYFVKLIINIIGFLIFVIIVTATIYISIK